MSKASILIVEDEAIVAADLSGMLRRLGYEISGTTPRGEEAISLARERRPDLVLLDIRLAGAMDGVEAAAIIHRELDLPVIFLTAHSDQATLERAKRSEPFGYLLKPFEELGLETHLEMALYKHRAERKLRQAHDELELRVEEHTRELRAAEQELRESNETLERRVVERTAELQIANSLLRDSRRAALNMMEDAIAARQQAEEINAELDHEATIRKQVEAALRESEERLKRAQEIANLGSWDLDLVHNKLSWSDEVYRIFGFTPQEFGATYEAFLEAVHPDDRAAVDAAYTASVREERTGYEIEHRVVRKSTGQVRTVHAKCEHFRDASGRIVRSVGMVHDISGRKRAEQRLDLMAETSSRLLVTDAPQEVIETLCQRVMGFLDCQAFFNFLVDEEAGRLHLNACAGIPEEEKQKIKWLDFGIAVCGCAARDACRIVVENIPDSRDPRIELVKAYGIKAYACHPLTSQGRVLGTLSFGTFTKSSFSDDDLALMKAVADQVAIAIERKRTEEALRQAKEEAETATRTKSQFLANMSHELRTPMTGVLGMLDLALAGKLEAEQRKFIAMAQTSGRSLVRILNDILDLTKIEMGKLSLEEKPFIIRNCLASTFNIFLPVAKNKEVDLRLTVTDDVPMTLVGDQTRLSQVLTNLAGNAIKFTEKGKVELRVTADGSPPGGKQDVTFTVTDTGIGIPDDKKHLLFRVFSQVDESHSREYGGTGLGLAISKEIVERMGGSITFTSEAGKGSTFSCTIPFAAAAAEQGAGFAAGKTTAGDAPRVTGTTKPRLLIAEDDQIIRKILEALLQRSNYELGFADNGEKAVEMWEHGEYDLILMDVQMPRLNGFEATAAIREQERSRGGHIPIIAMTANALKEDEARCLAAGMDAYISKPIDFKETQQVIAEIIRQKSSGVG